MRTLLILCINLGAFTTTIMTTMGQDDAPPLLNLDPQAPTTTITLYRHRWYNFRPRSIFTEDGQVEEESSPSPPVPVTEVKEDEVTKNYRSYHDNFKHARSILEDSPSALDLDDQTPTEYTLYRHGPYGFVPVRNPKVGQKNNFEQPTQDPIFVPVRPDEKDFDQPIQPGIGDRARLDWDRPDQRKYYYGTPPVRSTLPPPTLPPPIPSPTPWGGRPKDLKSWLNFKKHYNQLRAGLAKFLGGGDNDNGNSYSPRPYKDDPPRKPITLDDLGAHAGFVIVRSLPKINQNPGPPQPQPQPRPVDGGATQSPDYNNNDREAGPDPASPSSSFDNGPFYPPNGDERPGPDLNVPPSQQDSDLYPQSQPEQDDDQDPGSLLTSFTTSVTPPPPQPPAGSLANKNFAKKSSSAYIPDFRRRLYIPKPKTKVQNNGINIVRRGGKAGGGSRTNLPPDGAILTIVVRKKDKDTKVAAATFGPGDGGGGDGRSIVSDSSATVRRPVLNRNDDDDDEDENRPDMPWGVLGQHLAEEQMKTTQAGNSTKAPEFSVGIADALTFESKKLSTTQQQSDYDVYRHFYE